MLLARLHAAAVMEAAAWLGGCMPPQICCRALALNRPAGLRLWLPKPDALCARTRLLHAAGQPRAYSQPRRRSLQAGL